MRTKRPQVLAFPLKVDIRSLKPPAGYEKKAVNSWYIRILVHGTDNRVEVYRGKICLLIYDILQDGVIYFDNSFANPLLHVALEDAKLLSTKKSGEYIKSHYVTYFAPITKCASENSEYKSEFDALDKTKDMNPEDWGRILDEEYFARRKTKQVHHYPNLDTTNDAAKKRRSLKRRKERIAAKKAAAAV